MGRNVAGSWWTEVSVDSYSNLDDLLIFAKGAIPWIGRDRGLLFFLISPLVSYLPLRGIHCCNDLDCHNHRRSTLDFNHHFVHILHGINDKRKAQWDQFPSPLLYNEGKLVPKASQDNATYSAQDSMARL